MSNIDVIELKVVKVKNVDINETKITSPDIAFYILSDFIGDADREHFVILLLDTKNQINAIHTVSIGTLNSSLVCPREVFKIAIIKNAASLILAHNHPSGDVTPSKEDINITNRLIECGNILGIRVLDHIIVSDNSYLSFKEKSFI